MVAGELKLLAARGGATNAHSPAGKPLVKAFKKASKGMELSHMRGLKWYKRGLEGPRVIKDQGLSAWSLKAGKTGLLEH